VLCAQKNNLTMLHWAVQYQQEHVVQRLIDLGANVNARNSVCDCH
jgi:ankyrin repeat protein